MRDVIINIVTKLLEYEYFNNYKILSIHVNHKEYRVGEYGHKTFDIKNFEKWLTNDDIENYNITIELEYGKRDLWRLSIFTLWASKKKIDTSKFGFFEYRTIGSPFYESYDGNGLSNIINNNRYSLGDIDKLINSLIELDELIEIQKKQKEIIYNRLKKIK